MVAFHSVNNISHMGRRFKYGMKQRKQQYPVAWEKLGKAFPNLRLWYVDTEQDTLEEYPWANLLD